MVKAGELPGCRFLTVESEFAAMSAAIGASATGARTYTATASQGLLYMTEAVYNAAGLGLPIVMTVANRAIGAPINIWNDHSDSMSQRDCGWIQLYADGQPGGRRPARARLPARRGPFGARRWCAWTGSCSTHAFEPIDLPDASVVDRFLPPFRPAAGARPRRPGDDRRDGRTGGVHRGAIPGAPASSPAAEAAFAEHARDWAEHVRAPRATR